MSKTSQDFATKRLYTLVLIILLTGSAPLVLNAKPAKNKTSDMSKPNSLSSATNTRPSVNCKWLPGSEKPGQGCSPAVDQFLTALNGKMRVLGCVYDGSKLVQSAPFINGELTIASSKWSCKTDVQAVNGEKDALDLTLRFKLSEGSAKSAGIAAAFDFSNWKTDNYVMIPASVYNGNRNRIVKRKYAEGLDRVDLYKKDLQLTTTELPQLSPETGKSSMVEVLSCNVTTPAICFYNKISGHAFILLSEQGIQFGDSILDNSLIIEESPDHSKATVLIGVPGVRERKPEFIGFSNSPDKGANWKSGDETTLKLRLYSFESSGIPGLFEKFMSVRKSVTGPNHPRNLYPFSEISRIMTENIDDRFYNGTDYKFYCPENAKWISFGWVGGLMNTYPMLVSGDSLHLERVTQTFDFAIPRAQGKAGYFYGALNHDGKCFGREGYDEYPEICLTRKNGDVLLWMIKQFELLKAQGRSYAIKPEWEINIRRLAQAFADTWKKNGQWGNFVNIQTGEIAVFNSTGGASAIGGLAMASRYYHSPEYLKIAIEAAEYYYQRDFVQLGMTTGACADILQNADSESAAALMTSLMTLYELTGDDRWLEKSRNLANLCATWVVSYDYLLPSKTELAQVGAKLTGAVWASTQNKHGAPGFCTSSGDPLFKIYRATLDHRYAELMHDVVHAYAEGIQSNGKITERLTYCDADSRGSRCPGWKTGWNELNGILMAMELPGIYLQTDRDELVVFDHILAKVVNRSKEGITLSITNETKYDAVVTIFAETLAESKKPLGSVAFLKWPKVEVKTGEQMQITIDPQGKIILR